MGTKVPSKSNWSSNMKCVPTNYAYGLVSGRSPHCLIFMSNPCLFQKARKYAVLVSSSGVLGAGQILANESSPSRTSRIQIDLPLMSLQWSCFSYNRTHGLLDTDALQSTKLTHQFKHDVPRWPDRRMALSFTKYVISLSLKTKLYRSTVFTGYPGK